MCHSAWRIGISTNKAVKMLFHFEKLGIRMSIQKVNCFLCFLTFFFFLFKQWQRLSIVPTMHLQCLSASQQLIHSKPNTFCSTDFSFHCNREQGGRAWLMDEGHSLAAPSRDSRAITRGRPESRSPGKPTVARQVQAKPSH